MRSFLAGVITYPGPAWAVNGTHGHAVGLDGERARLEFRIVVHLLPWEGR